MGIQLDFQLPKRFGLKYKTLNNEMAEPVIIHRAILGSVERMMAVLCEHTGGSWPFWVSPRQICVVPIAPTFIPYAEKVKQFFHDKGFYADVDAGTEQFKKKVRNAAVSKYNFILVVGAKEAENNTANVRTRGNKVLGEISL